ncbi:hypothetical protein V8F20_001254 [Naviculisporaceae sp. PSN 640]
MDHLPKHQKPSSAPLEIPFLLKQGDQVKKWTYTAEPMEQRLRFVEEVYLAPILSLTNHADQARVMQKDIFFGFLYGLLGEQYDWADFVCPSTTTGSAITLANFEAKLRAANKISTTSMPMLVDFVLPEFDQRLVGDFVAVSRRIGQAFGNVAPDHETGGFLLARVALSIEMLSWTLTALYCQSDSEEIIPYSALREWSTANSTLCPYWREVNLHRLSSAAFYYSAGLPPLVSTGQPPETSEASCTTSVCTCSNAKTEEMMKHAAFCGGKDCRMLGPNMTEVNDIIRRGGIPLIAIEDAEDVNSGNKSHNSNSIILKVAPYQAGRMPFVAISHVWCGSGLGNPFANSLPVCQVQFLRYVTRMAAVGCYWNFGIKGTPPSYPSSVPTYFWLDTLCIPADRSDREQLKQRAINTMAFIYMAASSVIVVDPVVMEIAHGDTSDVVIAARMATCPWMRRCWTFQEGFLARELLFLLKDRFINPASWIDRWDRYEQHDRYNPRRTSLYDQGGVYPDDRCKSIFEMRLKFEYSMVVQGLSGAIDGSVRVSDFIGFGESNGLNDDDTSWWDLLVEHFWSGTSPDRNCLTPDSVDFFVRVWNELATRTTTMRQDLHSILAVLFGLRAEEVMRGRLLDRDRSLEERMLTIMRSRQSLPLSLILHPYTNATSLCPENRWAPLFPALQRDHNGSRERGRPIRLAEGMMSWEDEKLGWTWRPEDTGSLILLSEGPSIIPVSATVLSAKWGGRLPGCNSVARDFYIKLCHHYDTRLAGSGERQKRAFFIHGWLYGGENSYSGCLFEMISSTETPPVVVLQFICPATFHPVDTQVDRSSEPAEEVIVLGGSSKTVCVLKCDTPSWTSPAYRRPPPTMIQRYPKQISGGMTDVPWLIASAVNYALGGSLFLHHLYRWMISYLRNTALGLWVYQQHPVIGWLVWLPFSVPLGIGWAVDVFLLYSIRAVIHDGELKRLALLARSEYQALLAREGYFQDVNAEQPHDTEGASVAPEYWQFETWCEILVPILSGGALLLGGLKVAKFIPLWESLAQTLMVSGVALLVETALKVGVEAWICDWCEKLRVWWKRKRGA